MSRISHQLVCFVLLLYVATLGVAMAAPFMHTQATDLVCTSTGYKLVGQQDNVKSGGAGGATHLLECALCLASGIAPSFPHPDAPAERHSRSYALRSIPAARLAAVVSAPLPARGPPALS